MYLQEKLLESKLKDKSASWYMENENYASRIDYVKRRSNLAKGRQFTDHDTTILGQQFQMFENYVGFCESLGTSTELGDTPKIGLDVISGIYGNSISAFVGQQQNLKDEEGLVYFKQVRAGSTRGNVTQDQLIRDARRSALVYQQGYAFEKAVNETVSSTAVGVTTYNITLPQAPVKPGTVELYIPGMTIEAFDNRKGDIYGPNVQGSIDYTLGTITVQLLVTPAGVNAINCTWDTDFEKDGSKIPLIQTGFDKVNVKAEILALRGQTSIHKNFAATQRFGEDMINQDMVNTLINEITAEINYKISNDLLRDAVGETKYDPNARDGVAQYDHKQEFMDRWAMANVKLRQNAGKGSIQTILAGDYVCAMFDTIPRFQASNITADGCHIYGTIDGKTVIRCPHYNPLVAVGVYRGEGNFNTGYVHAPFMPLYVDGSIPSPDSIIIKEGLVTTWAAFKTLIPAYFTKFTLTSIPGASYV